MRQPRRLRASEKRRSNHFPKRLELAFLAPQLLF